MDAVLVDYFAAWNEQDGAERAKLLQRSLSEQVELVDPSGRWRGVEEVSDRISRYHATAPGAKVVPGSGVDAHNDVERYVWRILDPAGNQVMEGLDVAERAPDGRLRRIVMFHGFLPRLD